MPHLTHKRTNRQEDHRAAVRSFAVSLGGVLVTTLFRLLLDPIVGTRVPFITFLPAVLIGAWVGGWGGGLSATLLSALAASYFFVPPIHTLLIRNHGDQVSLITFLFVGLCISALGDAQRKAQRQAEQAAEAARQSAEDALRGEDALRDSEAQLRLALDGGGMGTWHWDLTTGAVQWSPRTKALFGLPPDALTEREHILENLHPDDRERVQRAMQMAMDGGPDYDEEYRVCWPDGSVHWLASRGRVHRDGQSAAVRMEGVIQNIDDRKRAEEERAVAYRRETLLNRIGRTVRGSQEPEQVQAAAVHALAETLGVDRAYYSALDLARDRSWIGEDYRRPDLPSLAGEYRISAYQIDPAAYYPDAATLVMPDLLAAEWSTPLADALRTLRVRSAVSVPVFDGDALVSTLAVAMADEPRQWTGEEIALVEVVAQQTRAALEASVAERREHRIATELQEALLPTIPTRVPGLRLGYHYRAAWDEAGIGGDFAAVFRQDRGISYLIVGDLSGKGLAAASQIAVVTNMLRFAVLSGRTVAGSVSALNDTLADHELLSGFATMFVGRYDAATQSLIYVNCGQDAGLVRRAGGGIVALPPTGPVLGAISGAAFTEETIALTAGDVLALYTDGLTEAGPTRAALLTGDGVADILADIGSENAQEVVAHLISRVDAYAGGIVSDDQCLLVGIVDG